MRISRENLKPGMFLETLKRGVDDLGFTTVKYGVLWVDFNECSFQVQSYFDKNLLAKGFEGDHVMSIRLPLEDKHFLFPKTAPIIASREVAEHIVEVSRPIKKQRLN
jgi:hypothetical protein